MIIKELNIKSFGKIKNKVIRFDEGFNVVFGHNEAGKTTLLYFILFMFYGTKVKKDVKSLALKDKYLPWDTSLMDGEITYNLDGTDYLLSRRFGEGAKKTGELSIINIKTGDKVSNDISKDIGKNIFGLNVESFLKTMFISGLTSSIESDKEGEITSKLSNISQTGDDSISYTKINNILENRISALTSVKRANPIIPTLENEIDSLLEEERNAKDVSNLLIQKKENLDIMQSEKISVDAFLEKLIAQKVRCEKFDLLQKLKKSEKDVCETEKSYNELQQEIEKTDLFRYAVLDEVTVDEEDVIFSDTASEVNSLNTNMILSNNKRKNAKSIASVSFVFLILSAVLSVFSLMFLLVTAISLVFGVYEILNFKNLTKEIESINSEIKIKESEKNIILNKLGCTDKSEYIRKKEDYNKKKEHKKSMVFKAETLLTSLNEKKKLYSDIKTDIENKYGALDFLHDAQDEIPDYDIDSKILSTRQKSMSLNNDIIRLSSEIEHIEGESLNFIKISEMLDEKKENLQTAYDELDTLKESKRILDDAYDELKNNFAPKLSKNTQQIFSKITNGKYGDIIVNDSFDVKIKDVSGYRDAKYFSSGTWEQLYFSLRLGIIDTIYNGKSYPVFLDDTFERYDDIRLKEVFDYLKELSGKNQIILCTCHSREAQCNVDKRLIEL